MPVFPFTDFTEDRGHLLSNDDRRVYGWTGIFDFFARAGLFAVTGKKTYWEIHDGGSVGISTLGLAPDTWGLNSSPGFGDGTVGFWHGDGKSYVNSVGTVYGNQWFSGDILGIAYDGISNKVWLSINGVWQNGGDPAAGTGEAALTPVGDVYPAVGCLRNGEASILSRSDLTTYEAPSGFGYLEKSVINTELPQMVSRIVGKFVTDEEINGVINTSIPAMDGHIQGGLAGKINARFGIEDKIVTNITGGGIVNATIPQMVSRISAVVGHAGTIKVKLPGMVSSVKGGAVVNIALPQMVSRVSGKTEYSGYIYAKIPQMMSRISAVVGIVGSISTKLPAVVGKFSGSHFNPGVVRSILPAMKGQIVGTVGVNGSISAKLPLMRSSFRQTSFHGVVNTSFPSVVSEIKGVVVSIDYGTLRHVRGVV